MTRVLVLYYSSYGHIETMAAQMRNFLDQAGGPWAKGALVGKVGSVFKAGAAGARGVA